MLLDLPASHVYRAAVSAKVLSLLFHECEKSLLDEAAGLDIGPVQASLLFPAGTFTPRMYFCYSRDAFLFAVGGCPSVSAASRLLSGYSQADRAESLLGMHPLVEDTFEAMRGYLVAMAVLHGQKYGHWCGYSLGGSIASAFAVGFSSLAPRSVNSVVTFGEPRTSTARSIPLLRAANIDKARFFNVRDPIPLVPPHYNEASNMYANFSVATMTNVNRWIHNGLGWSIGDDGGFTAADVPDASVVPPRISLFGWATGLLTDPVNEHAIGRYDGKLASFYQRVVAGLNAEPLQVIPPGHGEPLLPPEIPPQANQARKRVELAALNAQRDLVAAGGLPTERPAKPFYAARGESGWFVWHFDQPLVQCRGRREAYKIAGRYNSIAGQWNRSSAGDQGALLEAIAYEFPQE